MGRNQMLWLHLSVEGLWGLGVVIRDSDGDVMAAATWVERGSKEAPMAEARAIKLGLDFASLPYCVGMCTG